MSHTRRRPGLLFTLLVTFAGMTAPAPGSAIGDLSGSWRLFVDDDPVETRSGVVRSYHAFQKYVGNPIITGDRAWEGNNIYLYGTVLPGEGGGYRMWYHCLDIVNNNAARSLYATSDDGINWVKPDLGIIPFNGSLNNNIFIQRGGNPSVIHTPWEPDPAKRYKLVSFDDSGRFFGSWSADAIDWTDSPLNPVVPPASDVGHFVWDPHTERYIGYLKVRGWLNGLKRRAVGFSATTNFEAWPAAGLILNPDPYDDRWTTKGYEATHFYGLCAFAYESMYLGFLWVFRATDTSGYFDGPIFVELVSSHDGVNWTRQEAPRPPILPNGPSGTWDHGMVFTPTHPLVEGDTIRLYYGGTIGYHADHTSWDGGIGLATLRKDGFASLDAGATPGTVITRKLVDASGPLRVNYRAAAGWLKVEVLDADGNVVPGYSQADSAALQGDSVAQQVSWGDRTELPEGVNPLRLRFLLQNASLYSFDAGAGLRVLRAPRITKHPQAQNLCMGAIAQFSVSASGDPPLTWQWQKDGAPLAEGGAYIGTASPVLTVNGVDATTTGDYDCVVANAGGLAQSNSAALRSSGSSFTGVGYVSPAISSSISGITADGSVVCGTSNNRPFIWSAALGLRSLGLPPNAGTATAAGVGIFQGKVVVAVDTNLTSQRPYRWDGSTAGTGAYTLLPKLDGTMEWTVRAMGTNGTSDLWIVGSTLNGGNGNGRRAGRYKHSSNGTVSIQLPPGGHDHSDFHAVSDTGIYAGQYQYGGTAPGGGSTSPMKSIGVPLETLLGPTSATTSAVVRAISRDGKTLGGWSWYLAGSSHRSPVIWGYTTGPTAVPFIPGADNDNFGEILALNGDGTLAGGYSFYRSPTFTDGPKEALIWDPVNGTRALQTVLTGDYGLNLSNWSLQEVRGISADGTVLAGNGVRAGRLEGWVAVLGHSLLPSPSISTQPQPQQVCTGSSVVLSVVASGGSLTYRWQRDGINLDDVDGYAGSATATLTVDPASDAHAGAYRCLVNGGCGATTSDPAVLAVRSPLPADLDRDCDVDLDDLAIFMACAGGPSVPYAAAGLPDGCTLTPAEGVAALDFDADGDVDMDDFAFFQRCYGADEISACRP